MVAALTLAATTIYARYRLRSAMGHLRNLGGGGRVVIVLPEFQSHSFVVDSKRVSIPSNVRLMPMAEGWAIAKLVEGLKQAGYSKVSLASQDSYLEGDALTICVGGPSVNRVTKSILQESFTHFELRYPQHEASLRSTHFKPRRSGSGELVEDFGFIAVTRVHGRGRCLLLFGVWAPGTLIAATALLETIKPRSEVALAIADSSSLLIVAHAPVLGMDVGNVRVLTTDYGDR